MIFVILCLGTIFKQFMTSSAISFTKYKIINISGTREDITEMKIHFSSFLKAFYSGASILFSGMERSPIPIEIEKALKKHV